MNTLGTVGGVLIGILGLAVADYGLDPEVKYASQAFSLGIAGIATGGVVAWLSNRRPNKPIIAQTRQIESQKLNSNSHDIKYKNLYDGSPVMQRTVNTDGIILECNQIYVKNFGNSKDDIIGKSLFDHTSEKSIEDMHKTFETWKKSGRVENNEIWFKRKDGTIFPGLISANNIYDDKGHLIGSNTAIRDISEIYQAKRVIDEHERQKIQLGEIQKMDDLKEQFYMEVSQEFQIPLKPIKEYCEILKGSSSSKLTAKQRQAINGIYDNLLRLEQLGQDIIDVQKLETRKMGFNLEEFKTGEFIQSVVSSCSNMMEEKKIEFINKVEVDASIKSDKKRLLQVLYNLIQNAVDFVPQEGGKIEVGARENDGSILFYVKDNGIGISEKRKDSIFKKFYQVDLSLKRKYGGSGFGLVICKGIIDNLGGKIWFESKEGEGTTFYLTIPR